MYYKVIKFIQKNRKRNFQFIFPSTSHQTSRYTSYKYIIHPEQYGFRQEANAEETASCTVERVR